jgi:hypothetical protein
LGRERERCSLLEAFLAFAAAVFIEGAAATPAPL